MAGLWFGWWDKGGREAKVTLRKAGREKAVRRRPDRRIEEKEK